MGRRKEVGGSSPAQKREVRNIDSPITRAEHEEFRRRMEDEHHRTSKRITLLENTITQINDLTVSVKELAVSMKIMAEEQQVQGEKLEVLEARDGEMWRKVVSYVLTAGIGALISFAFTQF